MSARIATNAVTILAYIRREAGRCALDYTDLLLAAGELKGRQRRVLARVLRQALRLRCIPSHATVMALHYIDRTLAGDAEAARYGRAWTEAVDQLCQRTFGGIIEARDRGDYLLLLTA